MQNRKPQIEDELLVIDAQAGDRSAMDFLVRRWQKRLWQHAWRLTGNTEAAWDVTQQAWLGIVKGLGRLDDPAHFKAWVYRITSNKAADWIRQKSKRSHAPLVDAEAPSRDQDDIESVNELLQRMDPKKREAICLFYYENFSLAEMSMALDIPKGTVKSRLHAAREELRELWDKHTR